MESVEVKNEFKPGEKEFFVKHYGRQELMFQLPREKRFLCALHPYHGFPKLLREWDTSFSMTWCGFQIDHAVEREMTSYNIARRQYLGLIDVMELVGIKHRALVKWNLLWHPYGGAHIIDFGDAIWATEPDVPVPIYPAGGWSFCEMTDAERMLATLWGLENGKEYTEEMWRAGDRPWEAE